MTVTVITDGAAALAPEEAAASGVVVVPVRVAIGGEPLGAVADPVGEVVARFGEGVTSAAPSPGDFAAAFDGSRNAVVVTVAASLSSTHQSASLAAASWDGRAVVVDSGTAAGAQALVALAAARVAARGGTVDEVAAMARGVAGRVRLVGALETLDFLVRGGRVPRVAGMAGSLGLRPLFSLEGGNIRSLRPAGGEQAARRRMMGILRATRPPEGRLHVAALHALAPDAAADLLDLVVAEADTAEAIVAGFGPGMVVHTGPGVTGLAWWWERPGDGDGGEHDSL